METKTHSYKEKGQLDRDLVRMGLYHPLKQNDWINRKDMIEVLGSRKKYEKAVKSGQLRVFMASGNKSAAWVSRKDWEDFISEYTS